MLRSKSIASLWTHTPLPPPQTLRTQIVNDFPDADDKGHGSATPPHLKFPAVILANSQLVLILICSTLTFLRTSSSAFVFVPLYPLPLGENTALVATTTILVR